jgi:hypothetical protein
VSSRGSHRKYRYSNPALPRSRFDTSGQS